MQDLIFKLSIENIWLKKETTNQHGFILVE